MGEAVLRVHNQQERTVQASVSSNTRRYQTLSRNDLWKRYVDQWRTLD